MAMARRRPSGWWYPWVFVVGMLVVIVVNVIMISLAVGTFPGLETEDAYRKGLAYNQTISAADAQAARGWHLELAVTPRPGTAAEAGGSGSERTAEVKAIFTDHDGYPIAGLEVRAFLVRPTHGGADVSADLEEQSGGRYVAVLAVPLPGQWDVRVHARRGDETFQATHRVMMP